MLLSMLLVEDFLVKPLGLDAIDRSTIIYANVGNLLLPLVSMALGDEMVFISSSFQIPFNFIALDPLLLLHHQGRYNCQLKKASGESEPDCPLYRNLPSYYRPLSPPLLYGVPKAS